MKIIPRENMSLPANMQLNDLSTLRKGKTSPPCNRIQVLSIMLENAISAGLERSTKFSRGRICDMRHMLLFSCISLNKFALNNYSVQLITGSLQDNKLPNTWLDQLIGGSSSHVFGKAHTLIFALFHFVRTVVSMCFFAK